jgi:hypothetical protein
VPLRDLALLERAATGRPGSAAIRSLVVPGGRHRWLYEDAEVRRTIASFLAEALDIDRTPEEAGRAAVATEARRTLDTDAPLFPKGETRRRSRPTAAPPPSPLPLTQEA